MTNAELDAPIFAIDRKQELARKLANLPKLQVTNFDAIDHMPVKSWLVRDLLGAGEFSCVFGKPGSGKSVWTGDLAYHVAAHQKWFGRAVQGGGVLYVAAERAALVMRRLAALRLRDGARGLPLAVVSGSVDLRTGKSYVDALSIHADALPEPPVLIVVDTLSRVLAGGDENSPKDMGALRDNLLLLQERTGAHVLVVHHIPADGTSRLRGHGVMLGSFDVTISVEKQGQGRIASVDKANDGNDEQSISFGLQSVELGIDEWGEPTTAPVVVPATSAPMSDREPKLTKNQQTLFAILHDAGAAGLSGEDWNERARNLDIGVKRKADLYDIRASLKAKNLIRQYGDRWSVRHD